MNPVIAGITLRQLLSRRRVVLLLLLAAVMLLVAIVFQLTGNSVRAPFFASGLLNNLGLGTLMPLVALLFGTGTLGSELDEGTAVYLLAKPINRWVVLFTKLAVAAGCSILLTCVPIFVAGFVALGGLGDGMVIGFTLAGALGSVVYSALFVFLSLVTGRALVIGLGYVLIWEGVLAGLFVGSRTFSVHQYSLSLADAVANARREVLDAPLALGTALLMSVLVSVAVIFLAGRRLSRIEIAGEVT